MAGWRMCSRQSYGGSIVCIRKWFVHSCVLIYVVSRGRQSKLLKKIIGCAYNVGKKGMCELERRIRRSIDVFGHLSYQDTYRS